MNKHVLLRQEKEPSERGLEEVHNSMRGNWCRFVWLYVLPVANQCCHWTSSFFNHHMQLIQFGEMKYRLQIKLTVVQKTFTNENSSQRTQQRFVGNHFNGRKRQHSVTFIKPTTLRTHKAHDTQDMNYISPTN